MLPILIERKILLISLLSCVVCKSEHPILICIKSINGVTEDKSEDCFVTAACFGTLLEGACLAVKSIELIEVSLDTFKRHGVDKSISHEVIKLCLNTCPVTCLCIKRYCVYLCKESINRILVYTVELCCIVSIC